MNSKRNEEYTLLWRGLLLCTQMVTVALWAFRRAFQALVGQSLEAKRKIRALTKGASLTDLQELEGQLARARTYGEWSRSAVALDTLEGANEWKNEPRSVLYNFQLLQERIRVLHEARLTEDPRLMADTLRAGLLRNLGGMGNPDLFKRCRFGTKRLIADYIVAVINMLEFLESGPGPADGGGGGGGDGRFTTMRKLEFFHQTRQAFGRTALLLSGGGALGMYHFGVIRALWQEGLLPKVISGASVGALIGTLVCCTKTEDLGHIFEPGAIQLQAFERRKSGAFARRLKRLLQKGVLMDVSLLQDTIRENIGDVTFQEAYQRTGRVMNVSVNSPGEPPRLLNYLTAPHVLMWSAATASCALTGLYEPVELMSKNPSTGAIENWHPSRLVWTDGSVQTDLPMQRLAELFNVNHFIVSQTNPHVIPFLNPDSADSLSRMNRRQVLGKRLVHADVLGAERKATDAHLRGRKRAGPQTLIGQCLATCKGAIFAAFRVAQYIVFSELRHRLNQAVNLGLLPSALSPLSSVMNQPYTGHVTIVPRVGLSDYLQLLSNPTEERRQECIRAGERATWPRIAFIKSHVSIEQALDECIDRCRRKLKIRAVPAGGLGEIERENEPTEDDGSMGSDDLSSKQKTSMLRIPSFGELDALVVLE